MRGAAIFPFVACLLPFVFPSEICPDGYENSTLIIVSMDGFRADYLHRNITPNLQSIKERGVSTPYMVPSYPTLTFPNHYTIVTGLFPESHGIIANSFCDSELNGCFSSSSDTMYNSSFWGGNPIWNSMQDEGLISATIFWVGSDVEISGSYPNYWACYNGSVPYEDRIRTVLYWLSWPEEERPDFIALYFDEPDHTAHDYGPYAQETDDAIAMMDGYIGLLLDGIEAMNLTSCVNLIIVADHGMGGGGSDKIINIDEYIPQLLDQTVFFPGAFCRIDVLPEYDYLREEMMQNLSCQDPALRQYAPWELPKRVHFSNNVRIEDIVLDLDDGYSGENTASDFCLEGNHGYDNYDNQMQPIFLAMGPDFKVNHEVEPFQNLELYELMCDMLGIEPLPNNGTKGSLYHLLENPPEYPTAPEYPHPEVGEFPEEDELTDLLDISECEGDLTEPEDWLYSLNFTSEEEEILEEYHLPWGIPYMDSEIPAEILLLYHQDHVTGYSQYLKMPLWTSFTLERTLEGTPGTSITDWSSDVRLNETNTPTCTAYESLESQNITQSPLFRPTFSKNENMAEIPFLISNSVPMSLDFEDRWSELQDELIKSWVITGMSDLNLVVGPIFDFDSDSFVDNFTEFSSSPQPASDFFTILTRCKTHVVALKNCPTQDIDTIGFLYHDGQIASNCLSRDRYAQMFSCKVRDVEKATGFTFFTDLKYEDATRLANRIHRDIWDHCIPEGADDVFPMIFKSIFG